MDLYGNLGATGLLGGGASLDTYFRLERDFGLDHTATDFYAGALHVPAGTMPGLSFTVGRQFLSEGPRVAFVADAAKVNIEPGGPVGLTLFGGQPRYFEPTYSSENLSQDEQVFGANVHTTRLRNGRLSLGFFEQWRDGRALRQLVTGAGSYGLSRLPGLPNLYGSFAVDTHRQNIDQGTLGMDAFFLKPGLSFNVAGSYYKPQDQGEFVIADKNRREDPIFELFSISALMQLRGGLRYNLTRTVAAFGDYSYQRYERQRDKVVHGHVASAGLLWLSGGDGLEVVRLEYYVFESAGGNVNGGKFYYESQVYNRILFRTKLDVAYYEKENNEHDTGINGMMGLGFIVCPGLVWELDFEGNHTKRFSEDYRFGFSIRYNFDSRSRKRPLSAEADSPAQPTSGRPL